jgi:RNA-binding protein
MSELQGFQRSWLFKKAHSLKPVVMIGQNGLTPGVIETVGKALEDHELIKIKFQDHKGEKEMLAERAASANDAEIIRIVGNIAVLYRQNRKPENRIYRVPKERG